MIINWARPVHNRVITMNLTEEESGHIRIALNYALVGIGKEEGDIWVHTNTVLKSVLKEAFE